MNEIHVGDVFDGQVNHVVDFGVFVAIDEEHDGLLHSTRMPQCKTGKSPQEVYKEGDKLKVRVIHCREKHYSIRLEIVEEVEPGKTENRLAENEGEKGINVS